MLRNRTLLAVSLAVCAAFTGIGISALWRRLTSSQISSSNIQADGWLIAGDANQ